MELWEVPGTCHSDPPAPVLSVPSPPAPGSLTLANTCLSGDSVGGVLLGPPFWLQLRQPEDQELVLLHHWGAAQARGRPAPRRFSSTSRPK